MKDIKFLSIILIFILFGSCNKDPISSPSDEPLGYTSVGTPAQTLPEFENVLERIRNDLKIPGFSAAITKDRKIVWAKGFGYANKENMIKATPETVYHLASLTKPFAATIIMQLIEENKLTLDTPISDYGIDLGTQEVIKVKHLLSHTSEGVPGTNYSYNGGRYANLDAVILGASGIPFCEILNEKIITPLNLNLTAPYPLSLADCTDNTNILENMAQGYSSNGQDKMSYQGYFGSAGGLVSNVLDMSNFSIALDNDLLLAVESKELMYTPTISNSGEELPYGIGWFIDNNEEVDIIWHYGYWDAVSTLILKIPEEDLSFVILANTDRLSSASQGIGSDEDVNRSVVAQEFLNAFVYGSAQLPDNSI
ncbi:serine hydrolase domain-containing protein [Candidatus Neomarinimicrobiota bacterium]